MTRVKIESDTPSFSNFSIISFTFPPSLPSRFRKRNFTSWRVREARDLYVEEKETRDEEEDDEEEDDEEEDDEEEDDDGNEVIFINFMQEVYNTDVRLYVIAN